MSSEQEKIKQALIKSAKGGEFDDKGNLVVKVSIKKLFAELSTDIIIDKVVKSDTEFVIYGNVNKETAINMIAQGDPKTKEVLNKYMNALAVRVSFAVSMITELFPGSAVEQEGDDVVVKLNTGRKVESRDEW